MTGNHYETALHLTGALARREVGCLELLDHFLARVEGFNPRLNAIVWMDVESTRQRARETG